MAKRGGSFPFFFSIEKFIKEQVAERIANIIGFIKKKHSAGCTQTCRVDCYKGMQHASIDKGISAKG